MKATFIRTNPPHDLQVFLANEQEVMASRALAEHWYLGLYYDVWPLMDAATQEHVRQLVKANAPSDEFDRLFEPYLKQLQDRETQP